MPRITDRARPIALILIGVALGATLVAPVAAQVTGSAPDAVIATTYTRSVSCAGLDFYPTDSATDYANDGTLRYSQGGSNASGVFRCDPGLPSGAIVTKVQFTLRDASPVDYSVHGCGLVRSGLTIATATSYQQLATVSGTGGPAEIQRLTDNIIEFHAIDNTKFGYWLECVIAGIDSRVGIYGANVIYTITATNG